MKPIDDFKTWSDFKQGQNKALALIYHQNVDFLFSYGRKLTTDELLILDTIHDLFCYIIEKKSSLGNPQNIRMYLLKAFRRRLFIALNKNNKLSNIEETHHEINIVFSIEEDIIQNDKLSSRTRQIKKALKKLNPRQREILFYKFDCEFDYQSICELMDISYSSARKIISRSISILREHLRGTNMYLILILRKHFMNTSLYAQK